jgi:hypothetical protein
MFENRVDRIICTPKRDEVTGRWIKLHIEEHHNLRSSPDITMRWAEHALPCMGEMRNV